MPLVFDRIGRVDVSEGKNAPSFATIPRLLTGIAISRARVQHALSAMPGRLNFLAFVREWRGRANFMYSGNSNALE